MIIQKTISMVVCGMFLMSPLMTQAASPISDPGKAMTPSTPMEEGKVDRIDTARSFLVVNDTTYGYSGLTLKVHKGERISGITALQAGQKIRFTHEMRKPGSTQGAPRVVTEIWINQN